MQLDATLAADLGSVAALSAAAEGGGYDGVWIAEVATDPFLSLALAAEHTSRVTLGTSIAVAFARNPLTVATVAHDLHRYSGGRFVLGLGSQIQPHIEKRFSMPWSRPAARMREFIEAVRAIWAAWNNDERLDFRGDFYQHTLMTPFFNPGPTGHGAPPIYLAAVGPKMTRVAAETADGLFIHPFTTPRYLTEVTMAAYEEGLREARRQRSDVVTCLPAFVVVGRTEDELAASAARARQQIAFYGSTPAYRPVLELHGWGALGEELNRMSKHGQWVEMAARIDDEMLSTFAAVGTPDEVAAELHRRYDGVVDRLGFATQDGSDVPADLVAALRQ